VEPSVINIICVRIQNELNKYEITKTVPHDLLEGVFNLDDIERCMDYFSPKHKELAQKLIKDYTIFVDGNLKDLRIALRKDYESVMDTLETKSNKFIFPTVMSRYRPNINPLTALYYDSREMFRRYNSEDPRHIWLLDIITDRNFSNEMLDSLSRDVKRLERVIQRYYWPFSKVDKKIPLELFHARQQLKDFRHYYNFFMSAQLWAPDE